MIHSPQSSIAGHLLISYHQSHPMIAFHVMLAASNRLLLQFMKAISIKRWKPALCRQKELCQNTSLMNKCIRWFFI